MRLERGAAAVKDLNGITDAKSADSAQVPGFVAFQSDPSAGRRIRTVKPSRHVTSPGVDRIFSSFILHPSSFILLQMVSHLIRS